MPHEVTDEQRLNAELWSVFDQIKRFLDFTPAVATNGDLLIPEAILRGLGEEKLKSAEFKALRARLRSLVSDGAQIPPQIAVHEGEIYAAVDHRLPE